MNALSHSFDDIDTAPLPWAMPIPIESASIGAHLIDDAEVVTNPYHVAFNEILTLAAAKANTAVSAITAVQRWTESANLTRLAASECLGMFSDTKPRASIQIMYAVATLKAWREREYGAAQLVVNRRAFVPLYTDVCHRAIVGSIALTGITAASGFRFDNTGALTRLSVLRGLLLPDTSPLASFGRYSVPNWDGDQADAILPETIAAARSLLQVLPANFGEPDIAPAADGTIGFEWIPDSGSLRKLFIDVGPKTVWRAYWRFANGNYGEANGLTSDSDISNTMRTLFFGLST